MRGEVFVRVVADVDDPGTVMGELMGGGATYARWGVCAFDRLGLVRSVLGGNA